MAPRKKLCASKEAKGKEKVKEGSSEELFVNEEARKRFGELQGRRIFFERGFLMHEKLEDEFLVLETIRKLKLGKLTKHVDRVVMNWIFEFYANAPFHDGCVVMVRDTYIDCSATGINNFFQLTDYDMDDFTRLKNAGSREEILNSLCSEGLVSWTSKRMKAFRAAELSRVAKLWQYFVCTSVLPTSHTSDISMERAILIYCLLKGLTIDFGKIISKELFSQVKSTNGALIFPCLISSLCENVGVPLFGTDVTRPVGHPIGGPLKRGEIDKQGEFYARGSRFKSQSKMEEAGTSTKIGKEKKKKIKKPITNEKMFEHMKKMSQLTADYFGIILKNQRVIARFLGLERDDLSEADEAPLDFLQSTSTSSDSSSSE